MPIMGYVPTNRRWAPELEISGLEAPAETFKLDPSLPAIGQDPKFPSDLVVIPRGRFVGVANKTITSGANVAKAADREHETTLTLANGGTVPPVGFAGYNMYMQYHGDKAQWRPSVFKNKYIRLPYMVSASFNNSCLGAIGQGDQVAAYSGDYNGAGVDIRNVGKAVKWYPKSVQVDTLGTTVTSTNFPLTGAVFSCFTPKVLFGVTSGGTNYASTGVTYSSGKWVAGFATAVSTVVYEYGQDASQIAGQCLSLELLDDDMPGWLKWVRDNYGVWDLPRLQTPGFTATKAGTAGQYLTSLGSGLWQLYMGFGEKIAGYKPITVEVSGASVVGVDGTVTSAAGWVTLPTVQLNGYQADATLGVNYSINPTNGILRITGVTVAGTAVTSANLRVSYSVEDTSAGNTYNTGQMSLSDGSNGTGLAGVPAVYDVTGSIGILRIMTE